MEKNTERKYTLKDIFKTSAAAIVLCLMMILQIGCESKDSKVVAITASSNMFPNNPGNSPMYLMEDKKTIWHAQSPPKYPEWVEIAFCPPASMTHLGIMAQDDSPAMPEIHKRGPKDFVLQGSNDRTKWEDLYMVKDNVYTKGGEWKEWDFSIKNNRYTYYRIYITASSATGLLTIQQILLR